MSAWAVLFAHIHQTSFNVETIGRSGPFLKGCLRWVICGGSMVPAVCPVRV
jgi:hypothetical protein